MSGPDIAAIANQMYEQALADEAKAAEERCARMDRKIEDQAAEGGFHEAIGAFIQDLCTYPVGVFKGPVIRNVRRLQWGPDGKMSSALEPIPTWDCVSPHDFFPGPNAVKVQDSYVCERVALDKAELSRMRGMPGCSTEAIDAILSESPLVAVTGQEIADDSIRAGLENRNLSENAGLPSNMVRGVEFWGTAKGSDLIEWGMEVDDPNAYIDICALLIHDKVIKAITMPDPIGAKPYYVTSYEKLSGDLWGKAIAEKMRDCQDACNATLRNLLTNLGLSSGPMVAVDIDALAGEVSPTRLYPWKVFQYHGQQTRASLPVSFFQPNSNASELLQVTEYFEKSADDRTLIPRYAHGNENVHGAGETASGMQMLMEAAAKGVKQVIRHMDTDVIRPAISYIFRWNNQYLDDQEFGEIKGDARVVARGAMSLIVYEQTQAARQQYLEQTSNPLDMQIIGIEGRAAILRKLAERLEMAEDEVVPSKERLAQMMQAAPENPENPENPEKDAENVAPQN